MSNDANVEQWCKDAASEIHGKRQHDDYARWHREVAAIISKHYRAAMEKKEAAEQQYQQRIYDAHECRPEKHGGQPQ